MMEDSLSRGRVALEACSQAFCERGLWLLIAQPSRWSYTGQVRRVFYCSARNPACFLEFQAGYQLGYVQKHGGKNKRFTAITSAALVLRAMMLAQPVTSFATVGKGSHAAVVLDVDMVSLQASMKNHSGTLF